MTRLRLTLAAMLALTLLRTPVTLLTTLLLPDAAVAPVTNALAAAGQSLLLFALPGWLLRPAKEPEEEKPHFPLGRGLLLSAVLAVLARATATPLNRWWAGLLSLPAAHLPQADGLVGLLALTLAAAVIPAVSEELLFRGALLGNLRRNGPAWQSLLLTTAMFALMHGSPAGLPGHLLIGFVLSALMLRTGRLAMPVAAHLIFNLLALFPRWDAGAAAPWICAGLLGVLTGWLLWGLKRSERRALPLTESLMCAAILLAMGIRYLI
ncbi:MAG: CPBP family intramembrane metalloprotease [Clostridiales bacterium]|nr:CPBP family intramembrane metalloprotease [Clostridiales bacterium]